MSILCVFSIGIIIISDWKKYRRFKKIISPILRPIYNKKEIFISWLKNKKNNERVVEKEIYEAISYLRNITAIGKGKEIGIDYVVQQLSENEGILKAAYINMLRYLRVNNKVMAEKSFIEFSKTEISKDFVRLLLQWEEINPEQLIETLISHQKSLKEVRITRLQKHDESISNIIYLPVVLNVVLLFLNFIYIGFFLEQKEMFEIIMVN